MESGVIDVDSLAGGFDLQSTLESGQSYLWWREDGRDYEDDSQYGGDASYLTTTREDGTPAVVRVRQTDGQVRWESAVDAESAVRRRLRLDDDLVEIRDATPADELLETAFDTYRGMRLVRDPPFGALVSFICSAQMHVTRIHGMQQSLRAAFGTPVEFDGETYHAYPTPAQLADATEEQLRDLSLGYRAPYVKRTAKMVADGEADPADARELPYEEARDALTEFVGVGDKVADCVLLFSLDYLEAVPLDTWIRKTITEYYPDCDRGNYTDTSRAIRERLGGKYAGYAQTYVFQFIRNHRSTDV
ncbi:DNA-3-methyladenine glycosylase family protein [Salinibaculum rarum]|uniref:DNA-3-methyladenine glycosylase family protein n=1 Tax=Salinibaculum rarum TaxID=3058903 RepID=UPI00265E4A19|nr:DNA glycosylase [Salinibaculum sp. KK48]